MAAMAPERSRTLHNFSLPPRLNWGTQKLLRCAKLNNTNNTNNNDNNNNNPTSSSNDAVSLKRRTTTHQNASFRSQPPPPPPPPSSSSIRDENNQIEVIREKLMLDLRSEVDKFRAAFLTNSDFAPPPLPESRPWNLRTRRSPATVEIPMNSSPEIGFSGGERSKFSVSISRQEVEDDFIEMIGRRPPRKPKKRPRYIQKQLDTLFPGLWLSEITADMYKVNDNSEPSK